MRAQDTSPSPAGVCVPRLLCKAEGRTGPGVIPVRLYWGYLPVAAANVQPVVGGGRRCPRQQLCSSGACSCLCVSNPESFLESSSRPMSRPFNAHNSGIAWVLCVYGGKVARSCLQLIPPKATRVGRRPMLSLRLIAGFTLPASLLQEAGLERAARGLSCAQFHSFCSGNSV